MSERSTIRDVLADDVDWLLELNNASVPHVNRLTKSDLLTLIANAAYARLIEVDGVSSGALIAFWPGLDYESANYRWFCEHFDQFLYVDRVMLAEAAKGRGLGRAFYDDLERFVQSHGAPMIALEVNSKPPNPRSIAFHEGLGFRSVGELDHDGGAKRVVLMTKPLVQPPPTERGG